MSQVRQGPGAREASETATRPPEREAGGDVDRVARQQSLGRTPSEPPDVPASLELTRDLGWLLTMASALGALVGGSWLWFPQTSVGMWAGYWVSACSTIAIFGAMLLRTSLPTALGVAVTSVAGGALVLLGALRDYPTSISVTMIVGGAGIVLGALMQADRRKG